MNENLHLFTTVGLTVARAHVHGETLSTIPIESNLPVLHPEADNALPQEHAVVLRDTHTHHTAQFRAVQPLSTLATMPEKLHHAMQNTAAHVGSGARFMPTGMHPWVNLDTMHTLARTDTPYLQALQSITGSANHGIHNQQTSVLALPFYDNREFARLHAAVRLVLPIIPALAAASPIVESTANGIMSNRSETARLATASVPAIVGRFVPEPIFTRSEYERYLLQRIYDDLAPYDAKGVLRSEHINRRAARARFSNHTIELHIADAQECPLADVAIAAAITAVIEALTGEFSANLILQQAWESDPLYTLLLETSKDADATIISNAKYLRLLRYPEGNRCRVNELWQHLIETLLPASTAYSEYWEKPLHTLLTQGTLSRRILRSLGSTPSPESLYNTYSTLCTCLENNTVFEPPHSL